MHRSKTNLRLQLAKSGLTALLAVQLFGTSGCTSFLPSSRKSAILEQAQNDPRYTIDGVQGPAERELSERRWKRDREELARTGDAATLKALEAYDAAQALYDEGKFAESEKRFDQVVEMRNDKYNSWSSRFNRAWGIENHDMTDAFSRFGDAIEEDSLFMRAESQFQQTHYADAQNSYEELLKKYPSTRHLDKVTRQLFRIARYWLNFDETVEDSGDAGVVLAAGETSNPKAPSSRNASALDRVPVLPNLTDKSRPLFDTYGRGEQALRSVWLHDATGPLADDALMMAANHHLRTENFVEAARLYGLLREQYPDSPHIKNAYYLGSMVALASYEGAAYDGTPLNQSQSLAQNLLTLFPDTTPEQRKQLQEQVEMLENIKIERMWNQIEYYQVKQTDSAIALHCNLLINTYPDSEYAARARKVLAEVEQRVLESQQSRPWYQFGRGPATPPQQAAAPQLEQPENQEPKEDGGFRLRLWPSREAPKLQPIDTPADQQPGSVSLD